MNQPVTPSYKSSRFWLTLLSSVGGFLIFSGVVGQEEFDQMLEGIRLIISGLAMLVPPIVYIIQRTREHIKTGQPTLGPLSPSVEVDVKVEPEPDPSTLG